MFITVCKHCGAQKTIRRRGLSRQRLKYCWKKMRTIYGNEIQIEFRFCKNPVNMKQIKFLLC